MKPTEVNILGIPYKIEYVDNPADVDSQKRKSLFGQIDPWTATIRVYDKDRPMEDIFCTILHEVLHGISEGLNLCLNKVEHHDDLDILAIALSDVLLRNGWIKT